jgi:UPF0755 protein
MTKRNILSCSSIVLLSGVCALAILFFSILVVIPSQAKHIFGQPHPSLSLQQRIYLSTLLLMNRPEVTTPVDPLSQPRVFQVQMGESARSIASNLETGGLIWNSDAFMRYLQYSGLDRSLQVGEYELSASMSVIEIARAMQDATPTQVDFVILPGWRLEEVASALPTSGLTLLPQEFLFAASHPDRNIAFLEDLPPGASLEGFLFPGKYELDRDITLAKFIEVVLGNFENKLSPELLQGFSQQGLDVFQAVTLASIIQRESIVPDEMPLISSVFHNRLRTGMKLDSDPTVQYALGYNKAKSTWWTNPLSLDDLRTDSPYNTYLYPGLPPGPIANPGREALKAVAFPAESPYFYFRAACDGSGTHVFSVTFEEHVNNACP